MKKLFTIVALLALSGCSAGYTEPTLSVDHPANPAAIEAVWPTAARTLDPATADPVTPPGAQPAPSGHQPEGGGHDHDAHEPARAGAAVVYACPMHPEATSDKPDQRCPKCGMKLVKRNQTGGQP